MWRLDRLLIAVLGVFMVVTFCSGEAAAEKKIGVILWTDEARDNESLKGIQDQLKKDGFGEPHVKYILEKAGGDKAKAVEQAQKFNTAKVDMVITFGTTAAEIAVKEIKDIPVIFSMVYDPVESKIARDWKSSGNNATGASSKFPLARVVSALKQIAPVKRLGVLYTPGERKSELQLEELQDGEGNDKIKVIPIPLTRKEDVAWMLSEVTGSVDAVYVSDSGISGDTIPLIMEAMNKAKVITATHLEDYVERGVFLGVCSNPYAVGLLAGHRASKVLKGAKPSSVAIEALKKQDVMINMKTVKATQIQIPEAFMKLVTKRIE